MDDWKLWSIPGPPKLLYAKKEVCAILNVSDATLDRMMDAGLFPRGGKSGPGGAPVWTGAQIACYFHNLAAISIAEKEERVAGTSGKKGQQAEVEEKS